MKKVFCAILAIIMCVCIVSCGKSDAVVAAEDAIAAIGTVTLESEEAILEAEKLYNLLTDDEKEKVENRVVLVDARETFDELAAAEEKRLEEERINAALPELQEALVVLDDMLSTLEFVTKYAGNVNGAGSMKFADSFTNGMLTAFDNIDFALIEAGVPEAAESLKEIKTNCDNVAIMLIDMGQRQSAENVPDIKSLSYDTINMIGTYLEEQIEFVDGLLAE